MTARWHVRRMSTPCPTCAHPMPLAQAVMVTCLDGHARIHAMCPCTGCGPQVTDPVDPEHVQLLRAAQILEAEEQAPTAGSPAAGGPAAGAILPGSRPARIEELPAAAARPWTNDEVTDFLTCLDLTTDPVKLAQTWKRP